MEKNSVFKKQKYLKRVGKKKKKKKRKKKKKKEKMEKMENEENENENENEKDKNEMERIVGASLLLYAVPPWSLDVFFLLGRERNSGPKFLSRRAWGDFGGLIENCESACYSGAREPTWYTGPRELYEESLGLICPGCDECRGSDLKTSFVSKGPRRRRHGYGSCNPFFPASSPHQNFSSSGPFSSFAKDLGRKQFHENNDYDGSDSDDDTFSFNQRCASGSRNNTFFGNQLHDNRHENDRFGNQRGGGSSGYHTRRSGRSFSHNQNQNEEKNDGQKTYFQGGVYNRRIDRAENAEDEQIPTEMMEAMMRWHWRKTLANKEKEEDKKDKTFRSDKLLFAGESCPSEGSVDPTKNDSDPKQSGSDMGFFSQNDNDGRGKNALLPEKTEKTEKAEKAENAENEPQPVLKTDGGAVIHNKNLCTNLAEELRLGHYAYKVLTCVNYGMPGEGPRRFHVTYVKQVPWRPGLCDEYDRLWCQLEDLQETSRHLVRFTRKWFAGPFSENSPRPLMNQTSGDPMPFIRFVPESSRVPNAFFSAQNEPSLAQNMVPNTVRNMIPNTAPNTVLNMVPSMVPSMVPAVSQKPFGVSGFGCDDNDETDDQDDYCDDSEEYDDYEDDHEDDEENEKDEKDEKDENEFDGHKRCALFPCLGHRKEEGGEKKRRRLDNRNIMLPLPGAVADLVKLRRWGVSENDLLVLDGLFSSPLCRKRWRILDVVPSFSTTNNGFDVKETLVGSSQNHSNVFRDEALKSVQSKNVVRLWLQTIVDDTSPSGKISFCHISRGAASWASSADPNERTSGKKEKKGKNGKMEKREKMEKHEKKVSLITTLNVTLPNNAETWVELLKDYRRSLKALPKEMVGNHPALYSGPGGPWTVHDQYLEKTALRYWSMDRLAKALPAGGYRKEVFRPCFVPTLAAVMDRMRRAVASERGDVLKDDQASVDGGNTSLYAVCFEPNSRPRPLYYSSGRPPFTRSSCPVPRQYQQQRYDPRVTLLPPSQVVSSDKQPSDVISVIPIVNDDDTTTPQAIIEEKNTLGCLSKTPEKNAFEIPKSFSGAGGGTDVASDVKTYEHKRSDKKDTEVDDSDTSLSVSSDNSSSAGSSPPQSPSFLPIDEENGSQCFAMDVIASKSQSFNGVEKCFSTTTVVPEPSTPFLFVQ